MDIHLLMTRFRLAGRELFNNYFRTGGRDDAAWQALERFSTLEEHLFTALVAHPAGLPDSVYGFPHPSIFVSLNHGSEAPWLLNRDLDSGYWDHPQAMVTSDAELQFARFFDWDVLDLIDYQYVRVVVKAWPSHPELAGKHALIESRLVEFRHPIGFVAGPSLPTI